jgi:methyl-accepting chemotaxis protein/methyl-accepting chemotaxis protein-1 (serine sensor receptor)
MAAHAASTLKSASGLVAKEQEGFSGAKDRLAQMVSAMEEIDAASGRISKINKVIDEIAFQTNILALNAAVEAARAGEAGLGFAVVADEVRSLAQRCSQAARETALLIDESIARTQAGRQRVDEVSAAIQLLVQRSTDIHRLVDEVHRGSEEQSRSVERIESALQQIEHSAQSTASGAEEGSVAAEELTAQAHVLQEVVATLEALVATRSRVEPGSRHGLVRRQTDAA